MKRREEVVVDLPPSRFCLCNCCGKVHFSSPFDMSLVEDIITQVKAWPELWLTKHPHFRHFKLKSQIWKDIAAKLNIEVDLLKKQWNFLKNQFKKELIKLSTSGGSSDDGERQVSTWQYFDQLSFLKEELDKQSRDLSMSTIRESLVSCDLPEEPIMTENLFSFHNLPHNYQRDTNETRSVSTSVQDLEDNNSTLPLSMPPKTRMSVNSEPNNCMKAEYTKSQIMMTELCRDNDEDSYYLMSILPTMKKLTNLQKMKFRSKVDDFLLEAISANEYSSYMNDFSPTNSLPAEDNKKRKCRKTSI